jgi:hypothetical protein
MSSSKEINNVENGGVAWESAEEIIMALESVIIWHRRNQREMAKWLMKPK